MTVNMSGPCCDAGYCAKCARWVITSLTSNSTYACGRHLNLMAEQHYQANAEGSDAILIQKVWNP